MSDITITLRKCLSEANRVTKSFATGVDKNYSGTFRDAQDVLTPKIKIETDDDLSLYNYCEISAFGRKYFARAQALQYKLWEIDCEVDVLSTYATGIKASEALVKRTQDYSNNDKINYYMNDGVFFTEQRQVVTYQTFKKIDPTTGHLVDATMGTDSYYLLVAGG